MYDLVIIARLSSSLLLRCCCCYVLFLLLFRCLYQHLLQQDDDAATGATYVAQTPKPRTQQAIPVTPLRERSAFDSPYVPPQVLFVVICCCCLLFLRFWFVLFTDCSVWSRTVLVTECYLL